jgi:hypothetical protein
VPRCGAACYQQKELMSTDAAMSSPADFELLVTAALKVQQNPALPSTLPDT